MEFIANPATIKRLPFYVVYARQELGAPDSRCGSRRMLATRAVTSMLTPLSAILLSAILLGRFG